MDEILPYGVPRNSLLVIAGDSGSGKSALVINIAKSFLRNGIPVLFFTIDDDPKTIVNQLKFFGVDVIEYLKKDMLYIVDGYSFRIKDKVDKLHMSVIAEVDPANMDQTLYKLITIVDERGYRGRGALIIDSLNEFLSHYDLRIAGEHIKNLRANIAKYRDIITICTLHTSSKQSREFLKRISYIVDGILITKNIPISTQWQTQISSLKQIYVKKIKGTIHLSKHVFYTIDREGLKKVSEDVLKT